MADSTAINIKRMEELMLNFHLTKYPQLLQKFRDSRRLRDIFPTVTAIKDKVVFTEMEVGEVARLPIGLDT